MGSLGRGLAVIQAFGPNSRAMTISEVAERAGLNRAAARRLLLTLVRLDFARTDGKRFELTPKILSLGYAYLASLDFWEAALPFIEEVTEKLDESCSAAVLDGSSAVLRGPLRGEAPDHVGRAERRDPAPRPRHLHGPGAPCRAGILFPGRLPAGTELKRHTRRTITTPDGLRIRLKSVRERGFAFVDQELEEGLRSIAVPIYSHVGSAFAALNVSSHVARASRTAMLRRYLPVLRDAASKIATHRVV